MHKAYMSLLMNPFFQEGKVSQKFKSVVDSLLVAN